MSIASEIHRIKNNISAAYSACESKGATMPQLQNSNNLPAAIRSIPYKDTTLRLIDWDGTVLREYTRESALALSALPDVPGVQHELLTFQSWNWSISNIKAWIQAHEGECLSVGAIYTTADGQNHNYWINPRLNEIQSIIIQKRGESDIGNEEFRYCLTLSAVNIPYGAARIGNYAFYDCHALASVNIPESVTRIGNYAFYNCYILKSISIPDSVANIGNYVFYSCFFLTSVDIPDSTTSIGEYAFSNCYSLTSVNIPNSVTGISKGMFSDCHVLSSVNIPESVTSIGEYAFSYCYSISAVNIPDSVTSIGKNAFYNCNAISSVIIPDSVTSIGEYAFYGCRSLFVVDICDSLTSIADHMFCNCSALSEVVLRAKPVLININAFENGPSTRRYYVPRENLSWFESATNWSALYSQFYAIEDYIDYLESVGIDVGEYR